MKTEKLMWIVVVLPKLQAVVKVVSVLVAVVAPTAAALTQTQLRPRCIVNPSCPLKTDHPHGSKSLNGKRDGASHEAHVIYVPQSSHSMDQLNDVRACKEDSNTSIRGLMGYGMCQDIPQVNQYMLVIAYGQLKSMMLTTPVESPCPVNVLQRRA